VLKRRADVGEITLLYGVRDAGELCFTQRFGAWAGQGIRVYPVVSQPKPGSWDGRTGHVQDYLPKEFAEPEATVAFLCGLPRWTAMYPPPSSRAASTGAGLPQLVAVA